MTVKITEVLLQAIRGPLEFNVVGEHISESATIKLEPEKALVLTA